MLHQSFDVVAVLIVTLVALALALLGLPDGILVFLLGVPLTLFSPGYALLAWRAQGTFTLPMRVVLSVGLSVGLTTISGWLLAWTPWGLPSQAGALVLASITVGAAVAALVRRTVVFVYATSHPPTLRHPLVLAAGSGVVLALLGAAWTGTPALSSAATMAVGTPPSAFPPVSPVVRDALGSADPAAAVDVPAPSAAPTVTTPLPAAVTPTPVGAHQLPIALRDWPTRHTTMASQSYTDGQYRVALTGQPSIGVSSRLPADDYRLTIDIALEQGAAGLVFLAAEPTGLYRIMFDAERGYAIQRLSSTDPGVLDWTASDAVQATPMRVRVERRGETVQFFANDEVLTTFTVPDENVTNHVGVALEDAAGRGQAAFTNLVIEQLSYER